jgi:hypothetical protein
MVQNLRGSFKVCSTVPIFMIADNCPWLFLVPHFDMLHL